MFAICDKMEILGVHISLEKMLGFCSMVPF
jgi:hypothetical protein